ncbi:unnamed protein product [Moneuplotes crassus]|uniref:40S ribosomal protein S8 n=1 Tax=Euplotes crassus TaxID=5936 RepID=A0AAD1XRH3_EUPCR|nr:unnamed protein product [Moneuplotes crassus]CAI2377907.1 unnamed protein product [Moneuplotes crassus]
MQIHKKKRKFEMGRQPAITKLGKKKSATLNTELLNYPWQSESVSFKTKNYNTVYNATNNELTRTKTLVKNAIVQIDSTLFRNWYFQHYGIDLSGKAATIKRSGHAKDKLKATPRISSRPRQG